MKFSPNFRTLARSTLLTLAMACVSGGTAAQEAIPGNSLQSLLIYARQNNPEFAATRHDAEAVL